MLIGEMQKNSTEKMRVTTETYKGYKFIDIRVYYEDDTGEWKPTRKGIAIGFDKVDEIIELLMKARQHKGE